ncbi:Calcineurin-like phosphoesterase [Rhodoferax sp. OV413]|uniref:metallophosphoesterase n=1 Tax=Rhodoferax sp. OV413 TaxID=1855285 RepID=UPI000889187F|nr:metallophosphoesterase [Rhodoferax sp. OV413]SDO65186.1 Calcineurin-like phosphoesterase [Rhodoferax sp. OV413]
MKIQLLSDLHLEVHPQFVPTPATGADVLVLAGDIGSYQAGSQLLDLEDADFGLARFSPLPQYAGWPTPVLFVPGNHEYDGLDFDTAHIRLRATCERLGLQWLERESLVLQGVRFLGTTLWSDFDALGPDHTDTEATLGQQLKARDKAFRAANYYLKKNSATRQGEPMLADAIREQALVCQQWLRSALAAPFDGPTVVVTHFAPSLHSADPRYGRTPGTAGFCNALDALLPQARLWLHGHLHAPSDYVHHGCRVVANPRGYARKNEQHAFLPSYCIELSN